MEITDKWLMDMGGWAEMKEARRLYEAGSVLSGDANERQISAQVREGSRTYKSILVVGGALGASAVCGCPTARRGLICRHALAAGLAQLHGTLEKGNVGTSGTKVIAERGENAAAARSKEPVALAPPPPLAIELAPDWLDRLSTGPQRQGGRMGAIQPTVLHFPLQIRRDEQRSEPGPADIRVWQWLQSVGALDAGGKTRLPMVLQVQRDQTDDLLRALGDHPQVGESGRSGVRWRFSAQTVPCPLRRRLRQANDQATAADLADPASEVEIRWAGQGGDGESREILGVGKSRWWLLPGNKVVPLVQWPEVMRHLGADLLESLDSGQGGWCGPLRQLAQWLPLLDGAVEWSDDDAADDWARFRVRPARPTMVLQVEGSLRSVQVQLQAHYQQGRVMRTPGKDELADADDFPYPDPQHPGLWNLRQPAAELEALAELERAGFVPFANARESGWRLSGEEEVLAWALEVLPRWQRDWQVQLGERWQHQTGQLAIVRPHLRPLESDPDQPDRRTGSGVDWFGFSLSYEAEQGGSASGVELSRQDVLRLLRSGRRSARLPGGQRLVLDLGMIEQTEAALTDASVNLDANGRGRASVWQADYLDAVAGGQLAGSRGGWAETREHEVLQSLLPKSLTGSLRDYQWHGVAWLDRLARSGRGGILADEMGLGKTVQTLAWLSLIHRGGELTDQPSLVVCPTSLLGNWRDEAGRWSPQLRVRVHHGSERDSLTNIQADLIITSYGVLVRDLEEFAAMEFAAVILDEASAIKNPDTRNAVAARRLRATTRLALSGTPVENSVRDLWSILGFAMPGYLGGRKDFKERFEKPLTDQQSGPDPGVMRRLRQRLAPYLLRRRKRDVAGELPERIEQVRKVDPTPRQAEIYRRILTASQEEIADVRKRGGREAARMTMFTALLRLRQVCNDIRLLPQGASQQADKKGGRAEENAACSGKWQAFDDWLAEVREEGGKALVFSQFTSMLKLLRERLDEQKIEFAYLDGGTTDRDQQVRRFQGEPGVEVFLISLKAGGYGLNLTAANHVMLVDPWWNPAVEAQAIDRAHRIGQQQVVVATRLVTRGTVEEKILDLQARKRAVFDAALDDDQPLMQGLSDDDLRELLT